MSQPSKYNWLIIAIALLAIINLVFLGYIWFEKKDQPAESQQPGDARDYLVKELKLSEIQQRQFDSLRKGHFDQIRNDREEMKRLKDAFFEGVKDPADSNYKRIAGEIGAMQSRMDLNTFQHFAALRGVCNDQQKKRFDQIIENVLRNMGRGPGHHGPPPPGDRMGPPPGDGPPPPDGQPH